MKHAAVYTYSIVHSSTEAFSDKTPYCSAILEQEGKGRFSALLEGYAAGMEVKIGQTVKYLGEDQTGKPRYSL